ncbi:MAG: hypothetical protein ABI353_07435 [Isosphaeraceae bacterium]
MARFFRAKPLGVALFVGAALTVPVVLWTQRGDASLSAGHDQDPGTNPQNATSKRQGKSTKPVSLLAQMGVGGGSQTGTRIQPDTSSPRPLTDRAAGVPGSLPGSVKADERQGRDSMGDRGLLAPINPPRPPVAGPGSPYGAGSPSRLPTDPTAPLETLPYPLGEGGQSGFNPEQLDQLAVELLPRARIITDPAERSLAMGRIARSWISARKFVVAGEALEEASKAALEMKPGLVRDLRILAIVTNRNLLAAEEVRQGGLNRDDTYDEIGADSLLAPDEVDEAARQNAAKQAKAARDHRIAERDFWLKSAQYQWRRAAELAGTLQSDDYRSEILTKVVDSQANGSMEIANVANRLDPSKPDYDQERKALLGLADQALVWASQHARMIELPAWRDKARLGIVIAAASSDQDVRGLEIARSIPQPEFRSDALIRLAEDQAYHGRNQAATATFAEAARTVAAIPLADPRDVLTGVLIDSLITLGRFDDARASVSLYIDPTRRLTALGAVAQSQGQRGLAKSARIWIERDAPPEYRSHLFRRVSDGITLGIDSVRSQVLNTSN